HQRQAAVLQLAQLGSQLRQTIRRLLLCIEQGGDGLLLLCLPLVYPWVDDRVVAEVLSDWTGIPTGRMLQSDLDNALNLNQL
ncbi:hypothetical protein FR965_30240, partial [Serratia marcescens]